MKKFYLLLTAMLCLCVGNVWGATYGKVTAHTILNGSQVDYIGGVHVTNGTSENIPTSYSDYIGGVKIITDPYDFFGSNNFDYRAYATPFSGYVFWKWSSNIEGSDSLSALRTYGTSYSVKGSSKSSPGEAHAYAYFKAVNYQYSSSYVLPSAGGHFLLVSQATDKLLTAAGYSDVGQISDTSFATVFKLEKTSGSYYNLAYTYVDGESKAYKYYLVQNNGGKQNGTTPLAWEVEHKDATGFYYIGIKNGGSDKRFLNATKENFTEIGYSKGGDCLDYTRSWQFIPVYLFHTTAPTVVGGTQTWSVAAAKKVPATSAGFSSQSTTATFAATPAAGYTFKGWWDNPEFSGDVKLMNASYTNQTIINSNCADTLRYYAKFVPVFNFSATATKNVDGEGGGTVSAEVVNESIEGTTPGQLSASTTATFTATPFTVDGYSFEGWYTTGGDLVSYDNPYSTTLENTHLDGTTESLTLQAHFTQKTIPVFTFHLKVGIAGQTYNNVFITTNTSTSLTSVTNSNSSVATVTYDLDERTISVEALAKGQTTITVVQNGDETYTNKTLSYTISVVEQGEWVWQQDAVSSGDDYYVFSSTSGFLNDADGFDASPTELWTVGGTALSAYSLTASSDKTLAVYDNDWKWNVKSSGTYSGGDITMASSLSDGYYSIWRQGGAHATFGYGAYYVASKNAGLEMWSSPSYEWLFVSPAQKDAYDSYVAASEFIGEYSTLYPSLENELSEVIGANNYESDDWATCKANLDAIIAKCQAFDADYDKFTTDQISVTPTPDGFATFYSACPVSLPDGVTAYKGSYAAGTLTLEDIDRDGKIPACTPVVLYNGGTDDDPIVLTYYSGSVDAVADNDFHGSSYPIEVESSVVTIDGKTGTAYALGYKDITGNGAEAGFFKFANAVTSINANKAILVIDGGASLAAIRIRNEENNTTKLQSISAVLDENQPMYNVLGQRVDASYRGIIIQRGVKFFNY